MFTKRLFILIAVLLALLFIIISTVSFQQTISSVITNAGKNIFRKDASVTEFQYPLFYRGIYLSNDTACNSGKLTSVIGRAKKSCINTIVMDVQTYRYAKNMVPAEHVSLCINAGLHPVARVVVFPGGLKQYPLPEDRLDAILDIAEEAVQRGFREIQFDYIRFSDEDRHAGGLRHVSTNERYLFIEGFFAMARKRLDPYHVRIAADIFGRIPHNIDDRIGQKMEVLDNTVDIICPMAYPSHYWNRKLQHDPYGTVKWTSTEANRRTKKAAIVTYIQAFKLRHPQNMAFSKYIQCQIKAVHDSQVKGFILWNARQDYSAPLQAVAAYYKDAEKFNDI